MSGPATPDSVQKTIVVRCDLDTAFRTWTEQIDTWWPKRHSRSGDAGTTVLLERHAGGRLYERTSEGVEHAWGAVIVWEPPYHFAYHWYLGSGAEQPSRVDVRFSPEGSGWTRVDVSHRGPELIGALWLRTSAIFDAAWEQLLPAYSAACPTSE
jgi:hypothetical protein